MFGLLFELKGMHASTPRKVLDALVTIGSHPDISLAGFNAIVTSLEDLDPNSLVDLGRRANTEGFRLRLLRDAIQRSGPLAVK